LPKVFQKFANENMQGGKSCFKENSEEQQWVAIIVSVYFCHMSAYSNAAVE
jgi:hypothetical protein